MVLVADHSRAPSSKEILSSSLDVRMHLGCGEMAVRETCRPVARALAPIFDRICAEALAKNVSLESVVILTSTGGLHNDYDGYQTVWRIVRERTTLLR
jgi:hypothetical protein